MITQVKKVIIQKLIDEALVEKVFTSCLVGLVNKNGLQEIFKSGEADEESIFDVASVTKTVSTGLLMMKLIEKNLVKLDDKIQKYFPEFINNLNRKEEAEMNNEWKSQATILHLLSYTLEFETFTKDQKNDFINNLSVESFRKNIFNLNLVSKPGTVYKYSDATADIQGQLIEKVTGRKLSELFSMWVAQPLGLKNSTLEPKDYSHSPEPSNSEKGKIKNKILPTQIVDGEIIQGIVNDPKARKNYLGGYYSGCAGLFSNLADLSKVVQMFLNRGKNSGEEHEYFLNRESFKLMTENQLDLNLPTNLCMTDYSVNSLREILEGEDFLYQPKNKKAGFVGKSGFTGCLMFLDLEKNVGLIFLCNRIFPDGPGSVERLERYHKLRRDLVKLVFQETI